MRIRRDFESITDPTEEYITVLAIYRHDVTDEVESGDPYWTEAATRDDVVRSDDGRWSWTEIEEIDVIVERNEAPPETWSDLPEEITGIYNEPTEIDVTSHGFGWRIS